MSHVHATTCPDIGVALLVATCTSRLPLVRIVLCSTGACPTLVPLTRASSHQGYGPVTISPVGKTLGKHGGNCGVDMLARCWQACVGGTDVGHAPVEHSNC